MTQIPANKRNDGLDTLRSAAILLVFMYHYMVFVSHEATFGWASMAGWVGVDLFFVLSGYLIGNQIFSGIAAGKRLSLPSFFARRLLRTLPNYYVVLALYLLFPFVMGGKTPPALWTFLTFTQNYQLTPGTAFSHAWSLCIEEQFYLLLPLVVVLAQRLGAPMRLAWWALGGLIVAAVTLRSLLWLRYGQIAGGAIEGYYPNIYYSTFCRFDELLPGVGIALLKNFHRPVWDRLMRHGQALLALGLAGAVVLGYLLVTAYDVDGVGYGYFMTGFGYSLVALCFGVLTLAALSPASLLYRVRVPGAARLAAWSYAIYLTHKPIGFMLGKLAGGAGIAPGSAAGVALIVAASLLGGWLLYRLVEQPFMRLRERRVPGNFKGPEVPQGSALVR
ncbi:MAG: acyltransferase [Pseudomonadota bacterium]